MITWNERTEILNHKSDLVDIQSEMLKMPRNILEQFEGYPISEHTYALMKDRLQHQQAIDAQQKF